MTTFEALYVPGPLREAVSDQAWLTAMLEAEAVLAKVTGADVDEDVFRPEGYDIVALCEEGRADASPVVPLARALRERAPGAHGPATSQDILDTAAMLVARRARSLVLAEVDGAAAAAAALAEAHRSTVMAGRTLLQRARPTTFGLRAAGWLVALVEARQRLVDARLPAQLGGPAGTLDPELASRFASELGLEEPVVPWHADRGPIAELAGALEAVAAACGKVGLDVVLLAENEVGEVSEAEGGGSSSMPHKQNPASAVLARACARLVHANASLLTRGEHELDRAAGPWQAEWPALSAALAFAGGSAAGARRSLEGLRVHAGPDGRECARPRRRRRRGGRARRSRARPLPGAGVTALHHRFDGPEDAPVLVCSNSIGTTLELWERQVGAFAGPFRLLRYDQLGHGRSEVRPGPYTVELLGRELLALLDELGVARFSFCGLSLGGAVGMWLGANAGDRLERLVLAGTSAYFGPPERWIERAEIVRADGHGAARRRDDGPLVHAGVRRASPPSGRCWWRRLPRATPRAATRSATGTSATSSARSRRRPWCSSGRRTRRHLPITRS